MTRITTNRWLCLCLMLLVFFKQGYAISLNMPEGVTPVSHNIFQLHMIIFYICVAIAAFVFGWLFFSLIRYRKSKGAVPAQFHENTKVELLWTIIPFLILIGMAIPATKVLFFMNDYSRSEVTIKITGYQWRWHYAYLDNDISFFSNLSTTQGQIDNVEPRSKWYLLDVDNPLVLPVGKKVRFLITSNDVIHAWWVPDLGVKKDAIPGFIQESWATIEKPGTYRGQCSVLCGVRHAFMPIVVRALPADEYQKWLDSQQKNSPTLASADSKAAPPKELSDSELLALGKNAYDKTCAACHKPDGQGMPPAFPSLIGSKITIGPVDKHIAIVMHGVPGTAMQAFAEQLSDTDIAAIISYERNSWGNDDKSKYGKQAGGFVTPKQITAAR